MQPATFFGRVTELGYVLAVAFWNFVGSNPHPAAYFYKTKRITRKPAKLSAKAAQIIVIKADGHARGRYPALPQPVSMNGVSFAAYERSKAPPNHECRSRWTKSWAVRNSTVRRQALPNDIDDADGSVARSWRADNRCGECDMRQFRDAER